MNRTSSQMHIPQCIRSVFQRPLARPNLSNREPDQQVLNRLTSVTTETAASEQTSNDIRFVLESHLDTLESLVDCFDKKMPELFREIDFARQLLDNAQILLNTIEIAATRSDSGTE